jgi:hypothetical protein
MSWRLLSGVKEWMPVTKAVAVAVELMSTTSPLPRFCLQRVAAVGGRNLRGGPARLRALELPAEAQEVQLVAQMGTAARLNPAAKLMAIPTRDQAADI